MMREKTLTMTSAVLATQSDAAYEGIRAISFDVQ
jgi:hypothetical protein